MTEAIDYSVSPEEFVKMINKQPEPQPEPESTESNETYDLDTDINSTNEVELSEPEIEQEIQDNVQPDIKIPKSRFDEESARRQAAEEQLRQKDAFIEKLLAQYNQPPKPDPAIQQDTELDFLDEQAHKYYSAQQKKLENEIQKLRQESQQSKLETAVQIATNEFKSKTPEYNSVVDKYLAFKADEALETFGDPVQANEFVEKQLEFLTKNAFANGKNPAEVLYNLARKTVNPVATKTANIAKPNLEALNNNMRKSVTAPSNNSANSYPSLPNNLRELGSDYFLDDSKFNKLLEIARNAR